MAGLLNSFMSAAAPFIADSWDTSSATGPYTVGEANRLITDNGLTNDNTWIRSLRSYSTGKHRFEIQSVDNHVSSQPAIGVGTIDTYAAALGYDGYSAALYNSHVGVYHAGAEASGNPTSFPELFISDVMAVELDADAHIIYFKSTSTAGGRVAFSLPFSGPYYAFLGTFANADKMRANFGNAPWAVTPTAGYSGW